MSEPEKVADLIAEANGVSTNAVVANPRRYRNMIGQLADALEAMVKEMRARELHHFEEEQARAKAEAERDALAQDVRSLGHDETRALYERDEALAVIAEVREFASEQATEIRRQYGRTGPAGYLGFANACEDILDILSRITDKEQN